MVSTHRIDVETRGQDDMLDLTPMAAVALQSSGLRSGIACLCVIGSTAGLTTIEFEPGLAQDFPALMERLAPANAPYAHEETWHDDNGHSHLRASLLGPSLTIPFSEGRLMLGTWQQIVLLECDTRPRRRVVTLQLMGE